MSAQNPLTPSSAEAVVDPVEERFELLLQSYGTLLRRAIAGLCPRHLMSLVDDIEQEARLRLWNTIRSERKIENPPSYLYRVAATTTIDAVRKVKARREEPLDTEDGPLGRSESSGRTSPPPVAIGEQRELRLVLMQCFDRLRASRRSAVGLHLQGFTTLQIAEVLGYTEAKARNLAYRGLKDLRELLREQGIEYEGA